MIQRPCYRPIPAGTSAERRDRGQAEKSWLLFEGVDWTGLDYVHSDTYLYDLMRKSKIDRNHCAIVAILKIAISWGKNQAMVMMGPS